MIPVLNKRHGASDGVYVGRPSPWGNPWEIGRDGTRAEVIARYREYILERPDLVDLLRKMQPTALVCWCAPLPCHADILSELIAPRNL